VDNEFFKSDHSSHTVTRNIPGGDKEWPVREADNLTAICQPIGNKIKDH
jgi:hypothetical protein